MWWVMLLCLPQFTSVRKYLFLFLTFRISFRIRIRSTCSIKNLVRIIWKLLDLFSCRIPHAYSNILRIKLLTPVDGLLTSAPRRDVMPRVRVALVGKPCIRMKVRCNCSMLNYKTRSCTYFGATLLTKGSIDLSIDVLWLFLLFFNFISSSCFDLAFGQWCYLKKHFNISWCKVTTSSKKGLGLWSAVDVSWWRLVCVAKVAVWLLIGMRLITDAEIRTCTKGWSVTRITENCILMVLNRSFKRRYVIFVF